MIPSLATAVWLATGWAEAQTPPDPAPAPVPTPAPALPAEPAPAEPTPEPTADPAVPADAPSPPAEPAPEAAPEADVDSIDAPPEDPLLPYRSRFDALANRAIGTTAVPVEFDWRDSRAELAAIGSLPFELNNFGSARAGALLRVPAGSALVEFGVSYVGVWDTPSSRLLALTPYRQPGRPNRMEIEFSAVIPLAEGVVTAFPKFFPAVEMVFAAYAGLRYQLYPTGWAHLTAGEVVGAIFSPMLTETEIDNLESARLEAMEVDTGRYAMMLGIGDDLYFEAGLFLSPRLLVAVPLLAPATGTQLPLTADLSLAFGLAL